MRAPTAARQQAPSAPARAPTGTIEIEIGGARVRLRGAVDEASVRCVLQALRDARMIGLPSGTRVWIVAGHTDMRKGFDGLAALVQTALAENPFCGHVFVFRGRRGDILKVLWFDGQGLMLLAKRLERGRFVWPQATSGSVSLTPAQLSMLLEGIDWRMPVRTHEPRTRGLNYCDETRLRCATNGRQRRRPGTVDVRADHAAPRPTPSKRCCASSRSATPRWRLLKLMVDKLKLQLLRARRAQYGRSSEQLDDPQIALIEGATTV